MIALLLLAAAPAPPAAPHPLVVAQLGAPSTEVWQVDQLRVARDTDPKALEAIAPDHSLEAVMTRLKALGVPFTRHRVDLVPSGLPESLQAAINNLPPGEPFVVPEPDFFSINVVIGKRLPPGSVRWMPAHAPLRAPSREA